jgi:RNA polymerase sigma factor (TIGR02999 family)
MTSAFTQLYARLRSLAESALSSERHMHTLETGGLLAEAYVRLLDSAVEWTSREHFIAVAARTMRRILVDYARARSTAKRGSGVAPVPIDESFALAPTVLSSVVNLHEALEALHQISAEQSEVVELRFFGGLTHEEIAAYLNVSVPTVERRWRFARAWLYQRLSAVEP